MAIYSPSSTPSAPQASGTVSGDPGAGHRVLAPLSQILQSWGWPADVLISACRGDVLFSRQQDIPHHRSEEWKGVLFIIAGLSPPFILIFTRPGFAQSFGCVFAGSNNVSNLSLPHAFTISLANGF